MAVELPIPDRLRSCVDTHFGEVGRDWLERLPDLVARAARAWQLDVGAPFDPGGNVGWVAPVRRADGSEAALKISCPGPSSPWEAKALAHWAGRGAVHLMESDEATQTLLVERCVPGTTGDELDAATGNEVIATVLGELHAINRWIAASWRRRTSCSRPCCHLQQMPCCSTAISGQETSCSPSVDGWPSIRIRWSVIAPLT
jgi:hypothetical protein